MKFFRIGSARPPLSTDRVLKNSVDDTQVEFINDQIGVGGARAVAGAHSYSCGVPPCAFGGVGDGAGGGMPAQFGKPSRFNSKAALIQF